MNDELNALSYPAMIIKVFTALWLITFGFSQTDQSSSTNGVGAKFSKKPTVNLLVIAQSNLGSGGNNGGDLEPDERVKLWNRKTKKFETWTTNSIIPWDTGHQTWVFHFGKQLAESLNREVRFVIDAAKGQEIEEWLSDNGANNGGVNTNISSKRFFGYASLYGKIRASGVKQFDGVCYSQGEANSAFIEQGFQTLEDYGNLHLQLQSELINERVITEQTKWIIQEQGIFSNSKGQSRSTTNQYWDTLRPPFFVMPNRSEQTIADQVHFSGKSLVRIGRFHAWNAWNGHTQEEARKTKALEKEISEPIDRRQSFPDRVLDIDTSLRSDDPNWEFKGWVDNNAQMVGGELQKDNTGTLRFRSSESTDRITTDVDLIPPFTVAGVFSSPRLTNNYFWFSSDDDGVNRFALYGNATFAWSNGSKAISNLGRMLGASDWFYTAIVVNGANSKIYYYSAKRKLISKIDIDLSKMKGGIENLQFNNYHTGIRGQDGQAFYAGFAATSAYTDEQIDQLYESYAETIPVISNVKD